MCVWVGAFFYVPCSTNIDVAAAVKEELNSRVCVSSCVWVEYCCLLHYHRSLPLPPHRLLLQLQPEGLSRGGGSEGKEREREGE